MTSESTEVEVYLCPLHPGACRMAQGVCERCGIPVRMKPERLARLQRASRLLAYALAVAGLMALAASALGAL
jgi:hypothetical protein